MKRNLKDFTRKKQMYGRMFILPWEIGFVLFFLQPLVQSLVFVFSKVTVNFDEGVFETQWNGIENIRFYLYEDNEYMDKLIESLTSFVLNIPLIVALSLIVGVLLNQKFKGRVMFRSIFFLPVIIATGVVMTYLTGDATAEGIRGGKSNGIYHQSPCYSCGESGKGNHCGGAGTDHRHRCRWLGCASSNCSGCHVLRRLHVCQ